MKKQLLVEFKIFEAEDIKTITNPEGKKVKIMSGTIQRANSPNANSRVYPKPILEREDKKLQESIKGRSCIGELDHPESPIVALENGSHLITKTWWDGDDLKGEIEVLPTPKGKIVESYIDANVKLGISSRGLGSTSRTNEGNDLVEDDFSLVTYDLVSNPSTFGAYMNLNESKEWKEFCSQNNMFKIEEILDEILQLK